MTLLDESVRTHATRVAMMTCGVLPGPYRVPGAYRAVCHFRLTNKTPAATYRAPGRFETTFVREKLIDAIAHQLKLDRIEVRKINAVTVKEMPFKRPLEALGEEIHFDSGDYHALLDKLMKYVEWEKLNKDLAARRAKGELVGVGLAMFVEKAGLGPADGVRIQVDTAGHVEVITGGASIGQGFETVMGQVAAECLGTDYRKMRVTHGNTERIEQGIGAHASRATVMTASATRVAAMMVREKALDMAAELMQAPVSSLDIVNGEVVRTDRKGGPSMTLGQISAALLPHSKVRGNREPNLSAEGWYYADHQVYPYGDHLAVVKVDPDTGGVKVERYVIAYDIGRAINPMLVKGQIAGGFAQGLGGALLEEFTYSENGDPLAVTFADYLMPTVKETPDVEILLTEDYPSPINPLGIKGAGESGINGVGGATATAVSCDSLTGSGGTNTSGSNRVANTRAASLVSAGSTPSCTKNTSLWNRAPSCRARTWFTTPRAPIRVPRVTSAGNAPTSSATCRRAASTRARAARPDLCTDDGLPPARSASVMASNAAGLRRLVAL